MKARHDAEIKAVSGGGKEEAGATTNDNTINNDNDDKNESSALLSPEVDAEEERQRQIREKLGLKREKAREKERAKEQAIAEETANSGPAPRDVEMQVIQSKLPEGCQMEEVAADGHCLYRAVAAHSDLTYSNIRTS
jgi:OTU domain-containing protein 6